MIKKLLLALCLVSLASMAGAAEVKLDHAPDLSHNNAALQRGAKLFVNYCLNCHSASFMRYNGLRHIGLTPTEIKKNLMFTSKTIGGLMTIAMRRKDATKWFGVPPPDLSLVVQATTSEAGSGADWLYTYLRDFYRDDSRPTGWNNLLFHNVAMPFPLWQLQGQQVLGPHDKLELAKAGELTPKQYDAQVADLVAFLKYVSDPTAQTREHIGVYVMIYLAILLVLAYALKRNYWKDVH